LSKAAINCGLVPPALNEKEPTRGHGILKKTIVQTARRQPSVFDLLAALRRVSGSIFFGHPGLGRYEHHTIVPPDRVGSALTDRLSDCPIAARQINARAQAKLTIPIRPKPNPTLSQVPGFYS
jgi:hypothetical protein